MKNNRRWLRRKPVLLNRPAFLARLAVLLREGYTFYDGLYLLLPHHMKEYKLVLLDIDADFRSGLGVTQILRRFGFSSGDLLPIAIAEKDGRLTETLEGLASRLEKSDKAKRKLKNLLAYPAVLFVFITVLLIGFRNYFLPNMEALARSRQDDQGIIISNLPAIASRIPDVIFGTGILLIIAVVICVIIYRKLTPAKIIRIFEMLPVAGPFFTMWKTRIFANEMGNLLQSGLAMQEALDVLKMQKLDPILSEIAGNVKGHVIYGEPFHAAVSLTSGLTKQLASFAEHGAHNGHLPKELLIYSDHIEDTLNDQLTRGLAILQPVLFSLIAICILAAYIALLLPVYGMLDTI